MDLTEHATEEPEEGKIIEFKQPRKRKGPPPIPKQMPADVPSPEELMAKGAARKAEREQAVAEARPTSKQEKALQSKITDAEIALDVEQDPEKKAELNRQVELMEKQMKEMISRRLDTEALRDKLGLSEKGKAAAAKKKAEYLGDLPGFEHLKPGEASEEVQESLGELRTIEKSRVIKDKQAEAKKAGAGNDLEAVSGETESKASAHEMKEEPKVVLSEQAAFEPKERAWFQEGEKMSAEHEKGPDTDLWTLPDSIEPRIAQVKAMNIPGFDFDGWSSLYRRQHDLDVTRMKADMGETKVGAIKKLRMWWEKRSLGRALKTYQEEIDLEESAAKEQKKFDAMTPKQQEEWRLEHDARRTERKRQNQKGGRFRGILGIGK